MVRSGRAPNLNTYRILINACQRADQAQLAIEVYATMRAKKIPILQKVIRASSLGGSRIPTCDSFLSSGGTRRSHRNCL